ncbi:MAG: NAD(P)H-binding protein [Planctomycetaceae bacterium]|nr:NAD(P)H-binding protein [Planctomycetaceae bacterium]MBT6497554.1 NAD(P)H-binding protein [Planctomycetaceae bacterium]
MTKRNVLILGGYGTFGRHVAEDIAATSEAQVTIAGRNPGKGKPFAETLGVGFRQCDANDSASLRKAVEDAWLVINASGPFKATDYSIPQTCIDAGCHYIDMADGRDYVVNIVQLDEAASNQRVFVCAGASTTPAITSALVAELQPQLGRIRSIQIALNAGNRNQAGVSTIATILSYVGCPVRVWQDGRWRTMRGWSAGEFVEFPPPVGRRRVQLCDVPDLEVFPQHFEVDDVIFKAGVELTILNYAIAAMARLKQICPPLNLPSFARPLVCMSKLFKPFGTLHGGCAVWATDLDGRQKSVALVAHENGPRIPGSPAILLARKLLSGEISNTGAYPCIGFLRLADFAEFLAPFNIFVAHGKNGVWTS